MNPAEPNGPGITANISNTSNSNSKVNTQFHKLIHKYKGLFHGTNFQFSTDGISWIPAYSIIINSQGKLFSCDENNNNYLLLQFLQSCYVQIISNIHSFNNSKRKKAKPTVTNDQTVTTEPPVVFIKTYDNERLYLKVASTDNFGQLLSALIVWQNLKPKSLVKKWYCQNQFSPPDYIHEVLVCRFKVYGPIPNKGKNVNVVRGPKVPNIDKELHDPINSSLGVGVEALSLASTMTEGWFYTMGVLKSNGILNFITELDGTLLYSIDITQVLSTEIRQVHHSIFDNSNIVYIGHLKELRWNNLIKSVSKAPGDGLVPPFLIKDGKPINFNHGIFIEFPLHIDFEDWLVGLNYFAKREYIGSFPESLITTNDESESQLEIIPDQFPLTFDNYQKDYFRVSKKLVLDIIEAKFDRANPNARVYVEVSMWGIPWSRTAIVTHTANPFWKEEFSTDLPISTQVIHIVIKSCTGSTYLDTDHVIGTVYITPDILTTHLNHASTLSIEGTNGDSLNIGNHVDENATNDIVKLSIYDSTNVPIGKLLVNVSLKEYHVLAPKEFKPFETMLYNVPMKELIKFCTDNVAPNEIENVSMIILDTFQSLGIEDKWFKELMDFELVTVDKATRKDYSASAPSSSTNNVFNTLFRSTSILSKSLERYNLRIGQEYLEKVFGNFFAVIDKEKKNCEVDPRYVRLQERAQRKGKSIDDDLQDDSDDSDDESDNDDRQDRVKAMLEENYNNLVKYAEEIWNKIYITSNDLPEQIKMQLHQFRTKVELVCDPNDKATALNCVSAFLFLRFFCPAILNPKLFYLTKNHQTGRSQRTLTLIAKILLNLANRQEFSPHKEPHLLKMNAFLAAHNEQMLDYLDKITGRKNDFNEKILDLSHEVKRFDLGLSDDSIGNELPTTPYLIDKYLRLTEFIYLLDNQTDSQADNQLESEQEGENDFDSDEEPKLTAQFTGFQSDVKFKNNVYKIGSLEFEKSEFLDLAGNDDSEDFIKSLVKNDENVFSFITTNITLTDLQKTCGRLKQKIIDMETFLSECEYPGCYYHDPTMWNIFTSTILNKTYVDLHRNCLVQVDDYQAEIPSHYKKLIDNGLSYLKLKFHDSNVVATNNDFNIPKPKNIFKKWFR